MNTKSNDENTINGFNYIVFGIIIVIIGLWIGTYFFLIDNKNKGVIGDMFGSINSLFSGLALAGIVVTILLQRTELKLQRNELRDTRKEFEIQNRTFRLQRFEHTFFNVLSIHHQIINSIDYDITKEKVRTDFEKITTRATFERITLQGRDVFRSKYSELVNYLKSNPSRDLNKIYLSVYESIQTDFGHYFRNLYRIIKLVDKTEFHTHTELSIDKNSKNKIDLLKYETANFETKYKYTSIIRAQLSDYELLWLFYNCLSENGIEKFKPYLEKYSILKNIPKDKLHTDKIINEYSESAFNSPM